MELSIIIPAYNVEKYIEITLKSLINQTEKQFEVIIIDDGSTDNTLKIVNNIMAENQLINYKIIRQENGGVSLARNRGLNEASGKYVMFLDGDDYVADNLVETVYEYINKQAYDVICWGYNLVTEDKKTMQKYFAKYNFELEKMTGIEALNKLINNKRLSIWTGSAVYRRKFLSEHRFKYTEGCISGEDLEFTYKVLSQAHDIMFVNKILSYYVQRRGSITKSYNIKKLDAVYAMKRAYEYINSIDNNELKKIANAIREKMPMTHYLGNFNTCLSCLQQKGYSNKKCIDVLVNDIKGNYPEIEQEMYSLMKNYTGNDLELLIKVKAFLISPFLYNWLSKIKMKIN